MSRTFQFGGTAYGPGRSLIVAELSANHRGSLQRALDLVEAAAASGADAIKVQTFTADSMTLRSEKKCFQVEGTAWDGRQLHDIYEEAAMPWDWHPVLAQRSRELGLHFFSSPFDAAAVEFLEELEVPGHKIASFELIDIPLIERAAATGKPLIISTGMGSLAEVEEAVAAARAAGASEVVLLKCTSAYPSPPGEMNLRTISHLSETFDVVAGLSDHTLGVAVPVAAIALGAGLIEKHFILSRDEGGLDSGFSLEPGEFRQMVEAVRVTEAALGGIHYGGVASEEAIRAYRRSLYVTEDLAAGDLFTTANVRAIRPGGGLPPRHLREVLGKRAACAISRGTPLEWRYLGA